MNKHRANVFRSNIQKLSCGKFEQSGPAAATTYFLLFHAFHEFFKCLWEVDFETGIMRWCVFRMITDRIDSNKNFDFLIEIFSDVDPHDKVIVKGACPTIMQSEECELNNEQYVFTHYDMVKRFCKEDVLPYVVKIFPRSIAIHLPQ